MNNELATFSDIKVCAGNKKILNIKKMKIYKGDRIGIIGENGSGKTTFQKLLLNMLSLDFKGERKVNFDLKDIGVHLQHSNYNDLLKVKEYVYLITKNKKIDEYMKRIKIDSIWNKKIGALSGGELQRLNIYLVTFNKPDILFFDEPTTGLDFQTRKNVLKLINEVSEDKTLFLISHYFEEIRNLTDKIMVLHKGDILFFGSQKDYLNMFTEYKIVKLSIGEEIPDSFNDKIVLDEEERIYAVKELSASMKHTLPLSLKYAYQIQVEENTND